MEKEADAKTAASKCLEEVGLDPESYRIGHTKARWVTPVLFPTPPHPNLFVKVTFLTFCSDVGHPKYQNRLFYSSLIHLIWSIIVIMFSVMMKDNFFQNIRVSGGITRMPTPAVGHK